MRECPTCLQCFSDEVSYCPAEGQSTINSLPGELVLEGRYRLERRVGQGGMGVVYKARHVFLKSPHAIKVIMPDLVGNDPTVAARFRQEAMAAAAIRHSNIISVTDYGFISGEIPFLVMEFVEGNSLQDVMSQEGRFSPEKALEYISAIASGVGAAHRHGIVHRDLKPLNIMIQGKGSLRDGIRILDFGLAKIKSGDLLGSFVGAKTTGIIGSPYYMAPEQWSDEEPDKRCDIYSLGIILHQMLTGDVPFKGSSIPAVMKKHLMTPPPPLKSLQRGISAALERVVHHALEKEPAQRTPSAEALVAELEQAVMGVGLAAGKTGVRIRTRKPRPLSSRSEDGITTRVAGEQKKVQSGAARITAKQKKAQREEEAIARQTSDLGETLPEDRAGIRAGIVDETRVYRKAAEILVTQPASESKPKTQQAETKKKAPETNARRPAAEQEQSLKPANAEQDRGAASTPFARVEENPKLAQAGESETRQRVGPPKIHEEPVDVTLVEETAWSKTTEEVRPGAEERAPAESGDPIDLQTNDRVSSMETKTGDWAFLTMALPQSLKRLLPDSVPKPFVIALFGLVACALLLFGALLLWPRSEQLSSVNSSVTGMMNHREMVLIKGGTFTMGTANGPEVQRPPHLVTAASFYMDKTEVTNADYAAFVQATGHRVPANDDNDPSTKGYWLPWQGTDPPPGRDQWPVCNVSARDAEAFAQWLSERDGVKYRLPTEQEWEYAARNGQSGFPTLFPWGDSWVAGRANIDNASSPRSVGSFPEGENPNGLLDMVGNVWEWTSSKASFYDDRKVDKNPSANVIRGGGFSTKAEANFSPATDRNWFPDKFPSIGFRLVRDPE